MTLAISFAILFVCMVSHQKPSETVNDLKNEQIGQLFSIVFRAAGLHNLVKMSVVVSQKGMKR
jgi:hypothetical protein